MSTTEEVVAQRAHNLAIAKINEVCYAMINVLRAAEFPSRFHTSAIFDHAKKISQQGTGFTDPSECITELAGIYHERIITDLVKEIGSKYE